MPTLDVRLTDIPHDLVAEFGASIGRRQHRVSEHRPNGHGFCP